MAGQPNNNDNENASSTTSTNVVGTPLQCCCDNVRNTGISTGFYRNGHCETGPQDFGRHTVCAAVTAEFLAFSQSVGNDLSTPRPEYNFPGLQAGDRWCLCAQRWLQAHQAGVAPPVYLQATHARTLDYVPYHVLRKYAVDGANADAALEQLNAQRAQLDKLMD